LEKASKTYIGDDLHSFCSPLMKRPWDSHRVVPESLVNIAHLPKLNNSSGFAHDCRLDGTAASRLSTERHFDGIFIEDGTWSLLPAVIQAGSRLTTPRATTFVNFGKRAATAR
jgi:hypothetical protein